MRSQTALVEADDRVETLRDIEVPDKFFNRITTGVPVLDRLFGDIDSTGILPGSSTLFTGVPGAGKSTFCLQLADLVQKAGRQVLYNLGEENRYMVKMRADRLKVAAGFKVSQKSEVDDLVKTVIERKVDFLIQDSLQTLVLDGESGSSVELECAKRLCKLANRHDITVIIVGQVTKGGEFAGRNGILHSGDAHLHLSLGKDGARHLMMTKNRFGLAGVRYSFGFGKSGLEFSELPAEGDETPGVEQTSGKGARSGKRETVVSVARDRLLQGEMLSGYCFERLGVDCSGGFWRGVVADVCKELSDAGYGIGERKIDGRSFSFISTWRK